MIEELTQFIKSNSPEIKEQLESRNIIKYYSTPDVMNFEYEPKLHTLDIKGHNLQIRHIQWFCNEKDIWIGLHGDKIFMTPDTSICEYDLSKDLKDQDHKEITKLLLFLKENTEGNVGDAI